MRPRSIWILLLLVLTSCAATNRWPRWASNLGEKLECGMNLRQVEALTKKRVVEANHWPWGTHFIRMRHTDLWLDFEEEDGLTSIQLVKIDGWRFMSTRALPRRNLCTDQLTFFLRFVWSYELEGADVFLNGRKVGPSDWKGGFLEVSVGSHELRIEKEGHEPIIKHLQLTPEDWGEQRVDLTQ